MSTKKLILTPDPKEVEAQYRRLVKSEETDLAQALEAARYTWRQHRDLVEAEQFPERLAELMREALGDEPGQCTPAGSDVYDPDNDALLRETALEIVTAHTDQVNSTLDDFEETMLSEFAFFLDRARWIYKNAPRALLSAPTMPEPFRSAYRNYNLETPRHGPTSEELMELKGKHPFGWGLNPLAEDLREQLLPYAKEAHKR